MCHVYSEWRGVYVDALNSIAVISLMFDEKPQVLSIYHEMKPTGMVILDLFHD